MDTDLFTANPVWELTSTTCVAGDWAYNGLKGKAMAEVQCNLNMVRKSTYYLINIVIPVLLLSALISMVYWVPADEGEKMGYNLTLLLAYSVFLLLIGDILPKTSDDVPYLCKYQILLI